MTAIRVPIERRRYVALSAVAVGLLLASVVVPFILVDPSTPVAAVGRSPSGSSSATIPTPGGEATRNGGTGPGAGTSTTPGGSASTSPSSRSSSATVRTGPGVTATSIKIGVLTFGVASASGLGFAETGLDPAQQRRSYEAYIDEINDRGGINGRRLVPVVETFDVFNPSDERRACLSLTEDHDVFAIVGNFFTQAAHLCATEEHQRVLITLGTTSTAETYERSRGLLFTGFTEGDRMMRNFAVELQRSGALSQHSFGILGDEGYDAGASSARILESTIRRLGGRVGRRSHLSADFSVGSHQIPLEVQRMRREGVTAVLLIANPVYSTQFVREAESQRWPVEYFTTDYAALATDVGQANMPASYEGTVNFTTQRQGDTRAGVPDTREQAACVSIYERRNQENLQRDTTPWGIAMGACNITRFLELGIRGAGGDVTSAGLSAAIQSLGAVPVAQWGGGHFEPGKFGFNDLIRTQIWHADCRCVVPVGGFRKPGYA